MDRARFLPSVIVSVVLAAILLAGPLVPETPARDCGAGITMPSQAEIAAEQTRILSAGLEDIASTEAFDAADECAEVIRQAYHIRLGSFSLSNLRIDWNSMKDRIGRELENASREALDYACSYVVRNVRQTVTRSISLVNTAVSQATGGLSGVSRDSRGLTVTSPVPALISRQRSLLEKTLPAWNFPARVW